MTYISLAKDGWAGVFVRKNANNATFRDHERVALPTLDRQRAFPVMTSYYENYHTISMSCPGLVPPNP